MPQARFEPQMARYLQLLGTAGECLVLCLALLAWLGCRLDALLESISLLTALGVQVEGDGLHLVGGQLQPRGSGCGCGHCVCLPALQLSNSLTLRSKEEPQDLRLRQKSGEGGGGVQSCVASASPVITLVKRACLLE